MNKNIQNKLAKLPNSPGVYFYYDKNGKLIYIGKATVLRHRIRSYFAPLRQGYAGQVGAHDTKTEQLISQIADIKWQETNSVIEALILESNLIKKYQPKYNIREKDDKSFVQIGITKEKFPQIISFRPTQSDKLKVPIKKIYGPYTNSAAVNEILAIFRKIFRFRDCSDYKFARFSKNKIPCINYNINLCTGPCVKLINITEYNKSIRQIELLLQGHTKKAVNAMKRQMKEYSQKENFEKAKEMRDRIYAFEHLSDIAAIKEDRTLEQIKNIPHRVECYDISNLGADFAVGSMVVFIDGEIEKTQYRKFRIKYKVVSSKYRCHSELGSESNEIPKQVRDDNDLNCLRSTVYDLRPNDPAMMAQIIERRFNHDEWEKPDLILLDGGKGQLSAVLKVLKDKKIKLPIMAVAKGPTRKGFSLFRNTLAKKIVLDRKFIESMRDEAHRFAITYHRKIKRKSIIN